MEVVLGGLITLAVTIMVEDLRRPVLRITLEPPIDAAYPNSPAKDARFVRVLVENRRPDWFVRRWRATAASCGVACQTPVGARRAAAWGTLVDEPGVAHVWWLLLRRRRN